MWPFAPAVEEQRPQGDEPARARDIMAGDAGRSRKRWTRLLIVYLRLLAIMTLARGMIEWSRILGFSDEGELFLLAPLGAQISMVLLAVLSCIAGVGLWLTTAWGAVLWLIVTLCEILLPMTIAKGFRDVGLWELGMIGLAAIYLLLTWLAARERLA
jgi:hypothetical protein